jgi:hypothetical protein
MDAVTTVSRIVVLLRRDIETLVALRGPGISAVPGKSVQIMSEIAGRWGPLADQNLSAYVTTDEMQMAYSVEQMLGALVNDVGANIEIAASSVGALQAYYPGMGITKLAKFSNDVVASRTFSAGQRLRDLEPKIKLAFPNVENLPSERSSYASSVLHEMKQFIDQAMNIKNFLSLDTELIGTESVIGKRFKMDEVEFPVGLIEAYEFEGNPGFHGVGNADFSAGGNQVVCSRIGNGKWLISRSGAGAAEIDLAAFPSWQGSAMFRLTSIPFKGDDDNEHHAAAGTFSSTAPSKSAFYLNVEGNQVPGDLTSNSSAIFYINVRSNDVQLSFGQSVGVEDFQLGGNNSPSQCMLECLWISPNDSHSFGLISGVKTGTELKALIGADRASIIHSITLSKAWYRGVELEGYLSRYSPDKSTLLDSLRNFYEGIPRAPGEPAQLPGGSVEFTWYFGGGTADAVSLPTQRKLYEIWHDWMVSRVAALAVSATVARELQSILM